MPDDEGLLPSLRKRIQDRTDEVRTRVRERMEGGVLNDGGRFGTSGSAAELGRSVDPAGLPEGAFGTKKGPRRIDVINENEFGAIE